MNLFSVGRLVHQDAAVTTAAEIYVSDGEKPDEEITLIVVCNTSAAGQTVRLFHDVTGSTAFGATNALFWDEAIPAKTTKILFQSRAPGAGIPLGRDGRIGFEASATSVTVSVYASPGESA